MKIAHKLQKRLEQYIEKRLLDALGCPECKFSLKETSLGIHNHVFYLDIQGRDPLVLKGVNSRGRFKTIVSCSAYLAEKGISVPKVLYAEKDKKLFEGPGLHIICEERITGDTLQERKGSARLIADAARFLARLHSVTRSTWGKIDEEKTGCLHEYLFGKLEGKIKQWQKHDPSFPTELKADVSEWIEPWKKDIEQITTFSLCHGDPNPGNIILSTAGQLFLLDIGHIRYLPCAIDFYTLQLNLCEDNEGKLKIFEDAYCEGMDDHDLSVFKTSQPFFKVYVLIQFASMLAERLTTAAPEEPYHEEYVKYLKKAKQMISGIVYGK
jgi:Ser/Thr protein kinase RdoA (MazF antagonist)